VVMRRSLSVYHSRHTALFGAPSWVARGTLPWRLRYSAGYTVTAPWTIATERDAITLRHQFRPWPRISGIASLAVLIIPATSPQLVNQE
jgi:hypothetical protein